MSARAMRKLQGDALLLANQQLGSDDEEEESDEEEDEEEDAAPASRSAFTFLPSDSSSSEEDEEEDDNDSDLDEGDVVDEPKLEQEKSDDAPEPIPKVVAESTTDTQQKKDDDDSKTEGEEKEQEEDLDAILDEFKAQDEELAEQVGSQDEASPAQAQFAILLQDLDVRELDVDWSMRNALSSEDGAAGSAKSNRRNNRTFLFGAPSQNEAPRQSRPPNFIGGGIGMTSYDENAPDHQKPEIPPIYQTLTEPSDWYRFLHADGYRRDLDDFRYIQQTGDLNTLLYFVAHHPFVADALLQLTTVLYQANQSQNGMGFLRRCLWIYEHACLIRFPQQTVRLMDWDIVENQTFFNALQKLIHVSSMAGLWRTSLAVSRYMLALDPLRDPQGVLAVLDSYAICCHSESVNQWIIDMVESDAVPIHAGDKEQSTDASMKCGLRGMPNWAYSYALALFRVHGSDFEKANEAMQNAIRSFPSVVGLLLQAVEVDTTGRSLRRDWISVLDKTTERQSKQRNFYLNSARDTIATTATLQAIDKIISLYITLGGKVWGDDDVLQFLYDNLSNVVLDATNTDFPPLQLSVMRYSRIKTSDWETRIQHLPEDANIVDPGLVAQALVIDPNRPRLLRRMQQAGGGMDAMMGGGGLGGQQQQPFLGGPPTGLVDPDLPLAEVFWRSFMPWNHVEGVRGERR